MRNTRQRRVGGFSAVELVIAIMTLLLVAAMALMSTRGALPAMRVNAAMGKVVSVLRSTREMAIAQRRDFQIQITPPDRLQVIRLDRPSGTTVFPPVNLGDAGAGVQFMLEDDVPDTPDGFGNASAVYFAGTPTLTFQSDGTFVDAAGQPLNGSIFIGVPGQPATARAITILGTTGRVRSWHWTGGRWIE